MRDERPGSIRRIVLHVHQNIRLVCQEFSLTHLYRREPLRVPVRDLDWKGLILGDGRVQLANGARSRKSSSPIPPSATSCGTAPGTAQPLRIATPLILRSLMTHISTPSPFTPSIRTTPPSRNRSRKTFNPRGARMAGILPPQSSLTRRLATDGLTMPRNNPQPNALSNSGTRPALLDIPPIQTPFRFTRFLSTAYIPVIFCMFCMRLASPARMRSRCTGSDFRRPGNPRIWVLIRC